jgi:PAS domain S-box-containing protein
MDDWMDNSTLTNLLNSASDGLLVVSQNKKVLFANTSFRNLVEYDEAEIYDSFEKIVQGPQGFFSPHADMDKAIFSGRPYTGDFLGYKKSGVPFWCRCSMWPQFREDGSLQHFLVSFRDTTREKEIESKFSKLERDYRIIFENVEAGITVHGPDTKIRVANRRAVELLGISADALAGVPTEDALWNLRREDGTALPKAEFPVARVASSGGPVLGVTLAYSRPPDGKLIWFVCNAVPVFNDANDIQEILLSFSDVTPLKESEAKAEAFRERFELAAHATQDVIFEWNVASGEFWANEAYQTVYGYPSPSHIDPERLHNIGAVDADHAKVRKITQQAIQSNTDRYVLDYDIIRPDRTTGHVAVRAFIKRDPEGRAIKIFGTGTDIGQLTKANKTLEQSELRFRLIADTASDVLWDYDFDTKRTWTSPEWPSKLGLEIDASLAQDFKWVEIVDQSDRGWLIKSFQNALKSEGNLWEAEFKVNNPSGQKLDLSMRAAILRDANGRASRILGNMRNLTEQKRNHEGYTRSRALEAVGQLTGGIAHDFNNLLMIIQGNAELLEMSDLGENDAESVEVINKAADSAARLTRRLLAFSGQTRLKTRVINLKDLIDSTAVLLRSGLPESINLTQTVPTDVWDPEGDANGIEQAIINLAMNSRDAMPRGGTISITCENAVLQADGGSVATTIKPGWYVAISVSDTGEGMSEDVLSRAFEPFFTTKDVGQGTGLGLSTVYGFAKQSGGGVTISSEPGIGTTVTLYLPTYNGAKTSRGSYEDELSGQRVSQNARILVVEDEPQVRAHVERTLVRFGYTVAIAEDAHQALEMLKRGEVFDLLFTDIVMPGGMNGYELSEFALALLPNLRVLYTSGYPASAFENLGFKEKGKLELLHKPYRATELGDAVSKALER